MLVYDVSLEKIKRLVGDRFENFMHDGLHAILHISKNEIGNSHHLVVVIKENSWFLYEITETLGCGVQLTCAYLGIDRQSGMEVAIKNSEYQVGNGLTLSNVLAKIDNHRGFPQVFSYGIGVSLDFFTTPSLSTTNSTLITIMQRGVPIEKIVSHISRTDFPESSLLHILMNFYDTLVEAGQRGICITDPGEHNLISDKEFKSIMLCDFDDNLQSCEPFYHPEFDLIHQTFTLVASNSPMGFCSDDIFRAMKREFYTDLRNFFYYLENPFSTDVAKHRNEFLSRLNGFIARYKYLNCLAMQNKQGHEFDEKTCAAEHLPADTNIPADLCLVFLKSIVGVASLVTVPEVLADIAKKFGLVSEKKLLKDILIYSMLFFSSGSLISPLQFFILNKLCDYFSNNNQAIRSAAISLTVISQLLIAYNNSENMMHNFANLSVGIVGSLIGSKASLWATKKITNNIPTKQEAEKSFHTFAKKSMCVLF